jgi:hypothetical protein
MLGPELTRDSTSLGPKDAMTPDTPTAPILSHLAVNRPTAPQGQHLGTLDMHNRLLHMLSSAVCNISQPKNDANHSQRRKWARHSQTAGQSRRNISMH